MIKARVFSAIAALAIAGLFVGPVVAFADEHHGDAKCSGEKGCGGEKKCSGDKGASGHTGDHKCSGEKKCGGEKH